jgi:flavorubredoxin
MQQVFKVALPILIVLIVALGWTIYTTSREVVSAVKVLNPQSENSRALIVWHPGKSNFPERIIMSFADGLITNGWRVEITTASSQAPSDLADYDLIVLGAPVYWSAPARPLTNYLTRIGDLQSKRTVILLTASGNADEALNLMKGKVLDEHGELIESMTLYRWRPNREGDEGDNESIGSELAQQAARKINPSKH